MILPPKSSTYEKSNSSNVNYFDQPEYEQV